MLGTYFAFLGMYPLGDGRTQEDADRCERDLREAASEAGVSEYYLEDALNYCKSLQVHEHKEENLRKVVDKVLTSIAKYLEERHAMKEESAKKATRWSELFTILLVFIVVMGGLALVAYFISPFVLWLALITGLLFVILIIVYLKGPAELSEANFMQIIFRLFDALPLLRPNREVSRRENSEQQQVNASQAPLQPSSRGSSNNRTKTDVKP